mmetsp:Transcript_2987/g.6832  ORF Transcript_2987/g.6832 Transcript_2987/m.6832 type:complete len:203 (+) Transcript_2987:699-1307(+)
MAPAFRCTSFLYAEKASSPTKLLPHHEPSLHLRSPQSLAEDAPAQSHPPPQIALGLIAADSDRGSTSLLPSAFLHGLFHLRPLAAHGREAAAASPPSSAAAPRCFFRRPRSCAPAIVVNIGCGLSGCRTGWSPPNVAAGPIRAALGLVVGGTSKVAQQPCGSCSPAAGESPPRQLRCCWTPSHPEDHGGEEYSTGGPRPCCG